MKKNIKRLISLLLVQITLLTCSCSYKKQEYSSTSKDGVVTYDSSIGKVHISECIEDLSDDGVNILDIRYTSNPSMRVIESYKIKEIDLINEIVRILNDYNENYNKGYNWNRNNVSMELEWILHNVLYDLGIGTSHTNDVDFNNNELKNLLKIN